MCNLKDRNLQNEWLLGNKPKILKEENHIETPLLDLLDKFKMFKGYGTMPSLLERRYIKKLEGEVCNCCGEPLTKNNIIFRHSTSFNRNTLNLYCVRCVFLPQSKRRLKRSIGVEAYDIISELDFVIKDLRYELKWVNWYINNNYTHTKKNLPYLKERLIRNINRIKDEIKILKESKNKNTNFKIKNKKLKEELVEIIPFRSEEDFEF